MAEAEKYFLPYQREWILDKARLRICQKGRQIGLSYADSYDSVRKAALRGGRDVWVMSRDEAQAKQYIRYCKHWAKVLQLAAADHGQSVLRQRDGKAVQVQALSFASRASIFALSSNPDAIVGKTGHVKLDEFALHRDQRTLYAVAKPVMQWGGSLSVLSTHRGVATVFNEIITDIVQRGNRMGWSLHTIPIQKAVEQGLVERIDRSAMHRACGVGPERGCLSRSGRKTGEGPERGCLSRSGRNSGEGPEVCPGPLPVVAIAADPAALRDEALARREEWLKQQRAECIDEEQWLQEYCCVPADERSAFISYEMLTSCEDGGIGPVGQTEPRLESLAECKNPLYLGVDVARKNDLCVLDVGEKLGDVVWDRLRLELHNRRFAEIRSALYGLLRLPGLKRACIDATGLGMQLAEEAKADFGWKVEPVTFTAAVKEDLAFGLRRDFEECKLRIACDDKLAADLRGLKKEVTLSGNIRFAGETEDSHCDRFWAKALRQQAARYKPKVWAAVG
jgi:phage FluMu gp28-like protein